MYIYICMKERFWILIAASEKSPCRHHWLPPDQSIQHSTQPPPPEKKEALGLDVSTHPEP